MMTTVAVPSASDERDTETFHECLARLVLHFHSITVEVGPLIICYIYFIIDVYLLCFLDITFRGPTCCLIVLWTVGQEPVLFP